MTLSMTGHDFPLKSVNLFQQMAMVGFRIKGVIYVPCMAFFMEAKLSLEFPQTEIRCHF